MKKFLKCHFILACVCIAAAQDRIEDQSAATSSPQVFRDPQDRYTVTVPPAWQAMARDDTAVLSRGNAHVTIAKGSNGGTAQVQRLTKELGLDQRGFREVQRDETTLSRSRALSVTYEGTNAKGVAMMIKFVISDDGWTLLEILPRSQLDARKGGLSRIESTFRLSAPAATERPNATPASASGPLPSARQNLPEGMLDGVYVGLRRGEIYNRIDRDYLSFFPDGVVMRGMPQGGFDNFDPRTLPPQKVIGRYRAYGSDNIEIIWNSSPNDRWSVQRDESASDVHGAVYIPTCRCDGTTFSGVYVWGPHAIQFSPDGTFADRGVADSLHLFADSTAFFERPRAGQGTYAIRNHTLYLNYGPGRIVRASFAAPAVQEKTQSFDWIAIQQINTLYRQGFQPRP